MGVKFAVRQVAQIQLADAGEGWSCELRPHVRLPVIWRHQEEVAGRSALDPPCGCSSVWADHIRAAGVPSEIKAIPEFNRLKSWLGAPQVKGLACPRDAGWLARQVESTAPGTYDVVLFGPLAQSTFARYQGRQAL